MTMTSSLRQPASFRDPSGFLFWRDGVLYRQINQSYSREYDALHSSGLYEALRKKGWLVAHEEREVPPLEPTLAYKVIAPTPLPFISYPYEWCFSQLQSAAVLTLKIQKLALKHGLSLKDASAYNIQFVDGRPLLIDTLSFGFYEEGRPWEAYRQFCQHFLAPLALMAHVDVRLSQLLRVHIDGIPLDLASRLLPWRTKLSLGLLSHIHAHAKAQTRYADKEVAQDGNSRKITQQTLLGIIESLQGTVRKLAWEPAGAWSDYYDKTNYSDTAATQKQTIVSRWVAESQPSMVWDLGGNTGVYSRLASQQGIPTLCFDIDPGAVELNQRQITAAKETNLLPLLLDLTNPSPSLGWAHEERDSLLGRKKADMVMALALIHHLVIGNNVPLARVAHFFSQLAPRLIIEFVPKSDSQVKKLLASRLDIFDDYTAEGFEAAFLTPFTLLEKQVVADSDRILYLLERRP